MYFKRNLFLGLFALAFSFGLQAQEPYKNPALSSDERAKDLLSRMTLEEKIAHMQNTTPGVDLLGIPEYDWWNEALHGVARAGKATVFPQAIGMAATFDVDAVYETFDIISDEARAKHHEFKRNNSRKRYEGLTFWTPNINIFRDPRWGRGQETYGEDPYLTARMGVVAVRGLQGDGSQSYDKTHACAKHYAVHSGPEWNRHSYDAKNISERDLRETYLPAFQALVQEAGVKEIMCAYNSFEGDPCCTSDKLLMRILRQEWGFEDVVVSDCGAIDDFFRKGHHETHDGPAEASADAVISGTDLVCGTTYRALGEAIKKGLIIEEQIDVSMHRLLRAQFELGLYDPDSLVSWSWIPYSVVECPKHVQKSREMARKSIVLLENKNHILPLRKDMKVAVLGPNAADSVMLWSNYYGVPSKSVTILEGVRAKLSSSRVVYNKGCDYVDPRVFTDKLDLCSFEGKPGFKATFWSNQELYGEAAGVSRISNGFNFNARDRHALPAGITPGNFSARFETTYLPDEDGETILTVSTDDAHRIYIDGKEVISDWVKMKKAPREFILYATPGKAIHIMIEYRHESSSRSIDLALGNATETDYKGIAESVKDADAIIFVGGMSARIEGEELTRVKLAGFHAGDRSRIELPEVQQKMIKALKDTGKPVILVLCSGSSIALPWESENLDAILAAWYPGQQGGHAVADVLFGDYNPAGRTPLTFYSSVYDLPDFEDYNMNKGRTYRYYQGKPVYPFGYGLSYTTFDYSKGKLNKAGGELSLDVSVKNTGARDGAEVVQVYIRNLQDPEGPIKSLRGFQRVSIAKGETRRVSIDLPDSAFEFFNPETGKAEVRPGTYEILYGSSSDDRDLQKLTYQLK